MKHIAIVNGPNLNLLGAREPAVYGHETLKDLENMLQQEAQKLGDVKLSFFQSNHEGVLIDVVSELRDQGVHGLIINPAGYTHTSIALRDAIIGADLPTIEVHISNIYKREEFRHLSYISGVSAGVISGLGLKGYVLALRYLVM